jgi:tRNA nucleotidyltransferase (CCA-adding enzyme)
VDVAEVALEVCRRLVAAGKQAHVVGGCVRDLLLGRPVKDWDIATSAFPDDVQTIFRRTVPTGIAHGTVTVLVGDAAVEVTTYRGEGAYSDARRPDHVVFGVLLEEDLARRDFTMNAIAYDPLGGALVDPFGGRADLDARLIRAVGDPAARFREDGLRVMRAIRFAATLGFAVEPATEAAIPSALGSLARVSGERVRDELLKLLGAPKPSVGLEIAERTGILGVILPELAEGVGVPQNRFHRWDVWRHTMASVDATPGDAITRLGALLHDVAKPRTAERTERRITFYGHCEMGAEMAEGICRRLRRSRETTERVAYLVRDHLRLVHAPEMRLGTLKRFLAHEGIDELLELARLDALASNQDLTYYEFCRRRQRELGAEAIKPAPLIRGRDLLDLGLAPGPRVGEIVRAVGDAQLDGTLATREQALAWVRERYL